MFIISLKMARVKFLITFFNLICISVLYHNHSNNKICLFCYNKILQNTYVCWAVRSQRICCNIVNILRIEQNICKFLLLNFFYLFFLWKSLYIFSWCFSFNKLLQNIVIRIAVVFLFFFLLSGNCRKKCIFCLKLQCLSLYMGQI